MAIELLASQPADTEATSEDVVVGAGEVHTLMPKEMLGNWKVVIQVKNTADEYIQIGLISGDPVSDRVRQLGGPLTYRVKARACGVDLDAGLGEA